ncbi:MAG: hypothetical protein QF712_01155 [Candidatus Marinimicrobia bacterium]|jgi:hypothetical protein|nr:hypothetical protein [Candidatus Neomarinimicrobiota bacterium]MDP6577762.1 hypothetical protein [Candidatus Neomarinimicrobiota bacterium]MDP7059632.1 hypothetical protein [Candidatus Neomarinimicrobiota bacterium]|tara:strand:+ start:2082 stop:2537 length:456 start_codon:yes stop_codon:yes gene_type:complete
MKCPFYILFPLFLQLSPILAQQDTVLTPYPDETVGYIQVSCDSSGLDIYVDNILIGQVPIDDPVPIKPGVHTVTYLNPQFITLLREYYELNEVESLLERSLQRVYVAPDKTVTVNLWWKPYEKQLKARKQSGWIKTSVGLVIMTFLVVLNI